MHPDPAFQTTDESLLVAAERIGFANIFAATFQGPMVVHAPLTLHGDRLRFHVGRANRIAPHLDGTSVAISLTEDHGYVSANWYASPNQVPTWNYVTIEIDGNVRAIDEAALIEQLDRMALFHEPRENPWHRAKMDGAVFAKMLIAIRGFEVDVTAVRGTTKLSQNKIGADYAGVVAGLRQGGRAALAQRMDYSD